MSGQRADGTRDREIAAAYASGLTLAGCAAKFGIGREAVRGALRRTGTVLRRVGASRKLAPGDEAAAVARYAAGYSERLVAAEAGVSTWAVRLALRRAGVPPRSQQESARLRWQREQQGGTGTPGPPPPGGTA
jgi:hypothetical protein